MTFLAPERLWLLLLIPALVVLYVVLQRRRSQYAVRFTNLSLLDTVAPRRVNWRQHVAVLLALLTLSGALLLFARPAERVRAPIRIDAAYSVVVLVDTSYSMGATDIAPSRIAAASDAASAFLRRLPAAYRVSVVTFAQDATIVSRPTTNRASSLGALRNIKLGPYTAGGEGIYTALNVIRASAPVSDGHPAAFVVLLSDGKSTVGRSPIEAAHAAAAAKVPVYTVAVGTDHAFVDAGGQRLPVPVNTQQLDLIARITGGHAYAADSLGEINEAYQQLGERVRFGVERRDVAERYLGWLALLSLLSTAAGLFVASRWP